MGLRELARDVWVVDHPFRAGPLSIGTRTTVLRDGGAITLVSPGPLAEEDAAAIAALGAVRAVVAPNREHHLFLAAALARFSGAEAYAPAAVAAKKRLSVAGPPEAAATASLHAIPIGGMPRLEETAFVHVPSRTLVLTDFCFNLRPPAPWATRAFMQHFNGGFDRFGPTSICRRMMKDPAAVRASVERICAEDFDRVIVAHGSVLETGGRAAMAGVI